jgi:hypothetical protein
MTPQEKAKQLIDKFTVVGLQQRNEGIQCALICVEELLLCSLDYDKAPNWASQVRYWQDVKKEIEKL